jgi:WD40 repeat protein
MTEQHTTPSSAPKGGWLQGSAPALINEFEAKLPERASKARQQELLRELREKLETLREWDRWDPRTRESVVPKKNYQEVGVLSGHSGVVFCLQALPDGRIVSGSDDKTIRIWSKSPDGGWESEVLNGHSDFVTCLQALPDGRIVSGGFERSIRIWAKGSHGRWKSEVLRGHTNTVRCLQALPDGRIMSGSWDATIRIWDGTPVKGRSK